MTILSRLRLLWLVGAERRLVRSVLALDQAASRLDRSRKKLRAVEKRVSLLAASAERDVGEAERVQRQARDAVEAIREENEIYKEVTIPTLTAQHKLLLARYEAETAVAVRNQTMAQMSRRGEE